MKIAYLFEPTHPMTHYAYERIRLFASHGNDAFHVFTKHTPSLFPAGSKHSSLSELLEQLQAFGPDVIVRDAGRSAVPDIEWLRKLNCPVVVVDDTGDGAAYADYQLQTLYAEEESLSAVPGRFGMNAYIPLPVQPSSEPSRSKKRIVVAFPERDPENLTYRALRHITNLHVPIEVDVLIHPDYMHDAFQLQSFILQRKHLQLIETTNVLPHLMNADLAITSAGHMPYLCVQTATPAVLLAETKAEATYLFPDSVPAFIHLGVGRKVKQSALQNTIMEVLLHDSLLAKRKEQLAKLNPPSPLADILETFRALAEEREFTS